MISLTINISRFKKKHIVDVKNPETFRLQLTHSKHHHKITLHGLYVSHDGLGLAVINVVGASNLFGVFRNSLSGA
jgi:hypothetical protein